MAEIIYKDTFDSYDKDKSGFIDKPELKAMIEECYKKMNIQITEESLNHHLSQFDKNSDGKISLEEYAQVMRKYNPSK